MTTEWLLPSVVLDTLSSTPTTLTTEFRIFDGKRSKFVLSLFFSPWKPILLSLLSDFCLFLSLEILLSWDPVVSLLSTTPVFGATDEVLWLPTPPGLGLVAQTDCVNLSSVTGKSDLFFSNAKSMFGFTATTLPHFSEENSSVWSTVRRKRPSLSSNEKAEACKAALRASAEGVKEPSSGVSMETSCWPGSLSVTKTEESS